jgi:hypothetical protein
MHKTFDIAVPELRELKAAFVPSTFDAAARTVKVLLYSRGFSRPTRNPEDPWAGVVEETFSLEPGAMRMERLAHGVPLTVAHLGWYPQAAAADPLKALEAVLGKIEDITITEAGIEGVLRFSSRESIEWVVQDVKDGILDAVSMGARTFRAVIEQREGKPDLWTWVDWELCEGSITPIQADPNARTQSASRETDPQKDTTMPAPTETQPAPDAQTDAKIRAEARKLAAEQLANTKVARELARKFGLDEDKVEGLVAEHDSFDKVKLKILEMAADNQKGDGATSILSAHSVEVGAEAHEKQTRLLQAGMTLRLLGKEPREAKDLLEDLGVKPDDREVRRAATLSMMDIGESLFEARGGDVRKLRGLSRLDRVKVLMGATDVPGLRTFASSADMPILIGAALRSYTRMRFVERRSDWKRASKKVNLPDFESVQALGGGNFPALLPVDENGVYQRGGVTESDYRVRLKKAGRIFPVSWELILADRWGRIQQLADDRVTACIRYEDRVVEGTFVANKMADGTTDIFSVAHANISATTGTPSTATLKGGMKVMARQRGEPGKAGEPDAAGDYLKLKPAYWMLGTDDHTDAEALLGPNYLPTAASAAPTEKMKGLRNGLLEEPFLDDQDPVYSILIADPNEIVCLQHGYLEGADGPILEEETGFTVDGKDYKVMLPFYFSIVEYRGLAKIPRSG